MTKTAKIASPYTAELKAEMKVAYLAAATDSEREKVVERFAAKVEKSAASVRAVMSRAGYYIKKTYVNKKGEKSVKKDELVLKIADKVGAEPEVMDSLSKANLDVLKRILARFAELENDILALEIGDPSEEMEENSE